MENGCGLVTNADSLSTILSNLGKKRNPSEGGVYWVIKKMTKNAR
jgi:hypothetical protein